MTMGPMGVPKWRRPLAEEPAHGLLLHLVELNGYSSVKTVAECLGVRMSDLRSGRQTALTTFARAIRCPQTLLACDSPIELPKDARAERTYGNARARNTTAMSIRGVPVGADQFDRTKRKICPACLEESRHHRFWWDLVAVTVCARHKLRLVDRCGCGSEARLTWKDSDIFYCGDCSRDVPMARQLADPGTLAAEMVLLKRFGVTDAPPCPVLDGMSFYDTDDTMERVGAASIGGLKEKWQSARSLGVAPEVVRARGFSILSAGRLADLLDALLAEFKIKRPDVEPALTTAYGWLYHWLNAKGGRAFSEILFEAFVAHARDNFHVNGRIGLDASILPATYTLEKASKECDIGRETMRKLGVKLGMVSPSGIEGHVIAFDGPAVRTLAEDLRKSVDFTGAKAILSIHGTVLHGLLSFGLVAPLFGGREWRQQYAFRIRDLDDFIRKVWADAPMVAKIPEDLMSASMARERLNMSGGYFLKLVLDGKTKTAARLSGAAGVSGVLVRESELRQALMDLIGVEDLPIPLAAVVLTTTNPVVKRLLARGLLRNSRKDNGSLVTAASLAEFCRKYIGLTELVKICGRPIMRVRPCLAFMGIEQIPALSKCSFHGVSRPEIEMRIDEFRSQVLNDLRVVKAARRAAADGDTREGRRRLRRRLAYARPPVRPEQFGD